MFVLGGRRPWYAKSVSSIKSDILSCGPVAGKSNRIVTNYIRLDQKFRIVAQHHTISKFVYGLLLWFTLYAHA